MVNLDEVKYFYDAWSGIAPGFGYAPSQVREVAKNLEDRTMTLREAVEKIQAVTSGKVGVSEDHIYLEIKGEPKTIHSFRIIGFRDSGKEFDGSK